MAHPLLRDLRDDTIGCAGPGPARSGADGLTSASWTPFTRHERHAMVRDGLVVPLVGEVVSPALEPVTRRAKAEAVRALLPPAALEAAVLHRLTAAWFLSCAPAPRRFELMVQRSRRTTMRPSPPDDGSGRMPWEVRQLAHQPQDVDRLFGVRTTTPLRTAADLACGAADDPPCWEALLRLLRAPHLGVEPTAVAGLLRERPRLPGRTRGLIMVRRAARRLDLDAEP